MPDRPAPSDDGFQLTGQETAEVGAMFARTMGAMGLDGERIFAALAAGRTLGEALGLPSGAVDLLYARAHQWVALGRADRAEPLFRALCLLTGQADHFVGHGLCLAERGAFAAATLAFEDAARLRPGWPLPHLRRAEVALRQHDRAAAARALSDYDAAVAAAGRSNPVASAIAAEAQRLRRALDAGAAREARRP